ncbi:MULTISPECIES: tRNA pseudouridine(13) synthase TruD [unclassified Acinetobacter]|uniref:tRNA pseudouridine(13) synthase TruD n=1 Tax=unclassified Acinetobacter TaxID=196816 RepID=UPI0035B8ECF1
MVITSRRLIVFFEKILHDNKPYKPNRKTHDKHTFYISAARSLLFNAILNERVKLGNWNHAVDGDVFNLDGTGSIFTDTINDTITHRVASLDIHPTAVLYGIGNIKQTSKSDEIQRAVLERDDFTTLTTGLEKIGATISYRALRLIVKHLTLQWLNDSSLILEFILPSGTFATSVLASLCQSLNQPTHSSD